MSGPADLIEEVVPLAGRDVVVLRPRDTESLIEEDEFADDEFIPYWADLWPSAVVLARAVASRALRGARVLELGCGLGLPSIAAALAGGRVLATDWAREATQAAAENAARNDARLETAVCDWREPGTLLERGPWDLVLAADVLYERRNVEPLFALLSTLGSETWLADPGRAPATELLSRLDLGGWRIGAVTRSTRPRVTVHRLSPC